MVAAFFVAPGRRREAVCHLLKRNSVPAVTAWPWQFVRRTWDRPLEQCSGALRTADALHTACVSGGVLVNVLAARGSGTIV